MYLQDLALVNFKNFKDKKFEFSPKINAFVGNNGVGKTNVLDAVYYLSFFKSYLNYSDKNTIRFGEDFFRLEGLFIQNDAEDRVSCALQEGHKKVVKRNEKVYSRLSEHIGKYPVVIISPYDRDLISEGSSIRRKFMDSIISQSNSEYLQQLIRYNKLLTQRNALLKYFAANRTFDPIQLSIYDDEMTSLGIKIFETRKHFIQIFQPIFSSYYSLIANPKETVQILYESDFKENPENVFAQSLARDKVLQFTSKGIHKDDLEFILNDHPIKKMGSQGQQKSFLIALKLAQLEFIKEQTKITPILLLDDIFDKLDEQRVEHLIALVNKEHFGQIFISDTHPERTQSILNRINEENKIFNL